MSQLGSEILSQKQASYDALSQKRILWDNAEKLFHNQLNDLNSVESQSKVFDPQLSTFIIERAYRVMAQLGVGKVKGISSNDVGDAKLKNLLLEKYVVPNANSQFDLLTKFRMVDMYSSIYGTFDVLVDQSIKPNGYIGPDMWLLNKRDVFDQVGAISLREADQVIVRTWRPTTYFESLIGKSGFKNVSTIITRLKGLSGSKNNRDQNSTSKREDDQFPNPEPAKGLGYFEVLTRFERDRWVDICVDADNMEFRDQSNPNDDGELPVVRKYSIPLLDDPGGMGEMERGGSMQMAINSNWNLYFDGVRMSIQPPMLLNKDNIASISSIQPIPGALWLGKNNIQNMAMPINLSPQGISTFNNTHQVASAALQKQFGTSTTDVSTSTDQTLGKTPQALKMQGARENTRDNADRFYMEQFVSEVMGKFVNLMSKKQSGSVSFRMFPDEIEQIARDYPKVKGLYNEKTGKLTVKKGKSSSLYDWEIVSGSTYATDQKAQQDNLEMLMELWLKSQTPQGNTLEQQLNKDGFNLKFGELFKRIVSNSGIQDWDKILEEMTEEEKGQHMLDGDRQKFEQAMQSPQPQQPPMQPGVPGQMPPQQGMPQGQPPMPSQQMQGLPPQLQQAMGGMNG